MLFYRWNALKVTLLSTEQNIIASRLFLYGVAEAQREVLKMWLKVDTIVSHLFENLIIG